MPRTAERSASPDSRKNAPSKRSSASARTPTAVAPVFSSRLFPLLGANVSMGGGLALVALAGSVPVTVAGGAAVGLGFGLSLYRSVITGFSVESLRGGVVSVGAALGRVSATLAPIVMGYAVATTDPLFGFEVAVRGTVAAVGVLCGGASVTSLLIARWSPAVKYADERPPGG